MPSVAEAIAWCKRSRYESMVPRIALSSRIGPGISSCKISYETGKGGYEEVADGNACAVDGADDWFDDDDRRARRRSRRKPAQVEKPQPKPAEFLTGRAAFQKIYIAARGWARDAQPYRLESMITDDSKGKDGKSGVWRASFGSPAQRGVKAYTWSGEVSPDRGINPGTEDTYSPTNTSTLIFDVAFLKVDSDKALEVAQKHGGDKLAGQVSGYSDSLCARLESGDE